TRIYGTGPFQGQPFPDELEEWVNSGGERGTPPSRLPALKSPLKGPLLTGPQVSPFEPDLVIGGGYKVPPGMPERLIIVDPRPGFQKPLITPYPSGKPGLGNILLPPSKPPQPGLLGDIGFGPPINQGIKQKTPVRPPGGGWAPNLDLNMPR